MNLSKNERRQVFEWPTWAQAYAYIVAVPMIFVSLGIAVRLIMDYSYIFEVEATGSIFLLIAFLLSFLIGALLFLVAAQRIITKQSEALNFAASGHLMLLLPTMTILLVEFSQQRDIFIFDLNEALSERQLSLYIVFTIWLVIHAYFALFLSLVDNTTRFIEFDD